MTSQEIEQRIAAAIDAHAPDDALACMYQHASARQLVWWACLCGWSLWRPQPADDDDQALRIASCWAFGGGDDLRLQAAQRAASPDAGRCQWLLKAVVNSGGALATPDQPAARPTPDLAGRFIDGFLQQLLAQCPPLERMQVAQQFAELARGCIAQPLPATTVAAPAAPHVSLERTPIA